MEKPAVQIAFRVPPEIKTALETSAAADDRTLSSLLVRIIKEWLAVQRSDIPDAKRQRA